ncbi:hypothetical protein [Methyloceanibacter sp. wino2]|uniref:hypothetical protein n=1 Tax=Methyloceanibacter sp. wino2 TaxID=2170729 RepID=UPI00131F30C6|nr:hypothetical protein [Methyloceanibacter sp. wino2]
MATISAKSSFHLLRRTRFDCAHAVERFLICISRLNFTSGETSPMTNAPHPAGRLGLAKMRGAPSSTASAGVTRSSPPSDCDSRACHSAVKAAVERKAPGAVLHRAPIL